MMPKAVSTPAAFRLSRTSSPPVRTWSVYRQNEFAYCRVESRRLLLVTDVTCVGDHHQPGAGNRRRQRLAGGERHHAIVLTVDDERRHLNRAQPRREVGFS